MFDGLYEVVCKDENKVTIKLSDKKHPVFKAHFPRFPVLPGFVHFEIVADVFDMEVQSIKKAKFVSLVKPKEILTYERNNNKFKVFSDTKEVASFTL